MRPKLIALNLLLAMSVAAVVWQAKVRWDESLAARRAHLNVPVRPVAPPALTPAPKPEPAIASKYAEVADKDLFVPDRNPTIVVPPPVIEKPKPMPPLPVVFGVMGLPSGTKAIMAEKSGAASKAVREGDTVGEFKIVALNNQHVTFDWDGKQIDRKIEDLIDRSNTPTVKSAQANPPPPAASAPPPPPPPQQSTAAAAPGKELTATMRACAQGDTAPAGAVVDGYKKVVTQSIFGPVCRWVKQ